jgi:hypothetical protein
MPPVTAQIEVTIAPSSSVVAIAPRAPRGRAHQARWRVYSAEPA